MSSIISKDFEVLLKDGFKITEFNNYQFVKEKIIEKYILWGYDDRIHFEDEENFEREYVEDIHQVLNLIDEYKNISEVVELLKDMLYGWTVGKRLYLR